MYEYYFTFQSVTLAQRALSELLRKGVYAEMIRSPKRLSANGCGYALKVSSGDGYTASAAMKTLGITPSMVFRIYADGRNEVVLL